MNYEKAERDARLISEGLRLLAGHSKDVFVDTDVVGVVMRDILPDGNVAGTLKQLGWVLSLEGYFKGCWFYWLYGQSS